MSKVVGISQPIQPEPETSIEDRKSFVNYVQECLELYLSGKLDVVCFGFVDAAGVPLVEYGTFPSSLANDILALGMRCRRDSEAICEEAHDLIKSTT